MKDHLINTILFILFGLVVFFGAWTWINWQTSDEVFCQKVSLDKRAEYGCGDYEWK